MAEFGIPYMGSKDKICREFIGIFPKAENFYDLFGGGFSVTHSMLALRKNDFKQFHFNELRPGVCELIKKAINGEYNYNVFKPPFIDRETFFANVEKDAFIKCLWSFGNDGRTYLFSKEIEPYKKSMHNAIVFNDFDYLAEQTMGMKKFSEGFSIKDKRLFLRNRIESFRKTKIPEFLYPYLNEKNRKLLEKTDYIRELQQLQQLQQLEQLQRLERLQQLQQLERLEQLEFYNLSYDQVPIKENSIIYCDPPYAGTKDYQNSFNTNKFLDWAHNQSHPVFISEYNIPDKRFHLVFSTKKKSMLSAKKTNDVRVEKIYANEAGKNAFIKYSIGSK